MIWSHLHSMLLCELWDLDNSRVAQHIYFSSLPWPLNKILYWKQQLNNWNYLGLKKGNIEQVNEKMERKATEAYASLSTFLGDKKFFLSARPSSLDAVFLSHALFIMKAPLENSHLKEELNRHSNLVSYVENLQREFLDAQGSAPLAKSIYKRPKRVPAPLRHRPPVQRTEKVKNAKWRSKWFLAAQAASVILALYAWGISAIEIVEEDDEDSFDAD
ncbi:hypothetical protein KP509_32G006800 [Ceratopteris richardii]|nr:hypothetical protein KP509_32G006800 [Ceratopteris richardii]